MEEPTIKKALTTYTTDVDGAREEGEQIGIDKVTRTLLRAGDNVEKERS